MNRAAWILQVVLGLLFVALGVLHLVTPDGLPSPLAWMEDLSTTAHVIAGLAEVAGGLGLVLPSATRIAPRLTPLAAVGLVTIMVPAAVWHASAHPRRVHPIGSG